MSFFKHPSPPPPWVLTTLLPEINAGAPESWTKPAYCSLSEKHNGKQRAIVTQNRAWFLSLWFARKERYSDFVHHFLTTAPSTSAMWWKTGKKKKSIPEPNWKRWFFFSQREEEEVSNKTSHDTKGWEKDNKQVGEICCLSATLLSGNGITLDTSRAYQTAPHIRPLGETGRACFVCSNWVLCAGP